jgi:hypothetical protein
MKKAHEQSVASMHTHEVGDKGRRRAGINQLNAFIARVTQFSSVSNRSKAIEPKPD